ncbi:MAG: hypothetical protein JXB88_22535 [Spirochaetales bacterium]|nr:hypothetical protein [Spirochaetales bacterium]
MKPPICAICHKRFELTGDDCGLIYFRKRQSDIDWDKRMKETGAIGHPPYAAWFCKDHYKRAAELQNLSIDRALPMIREIIL